MLLPVHNELLLVKVVKVRIICARSGNTVILLPPTHKQGSTCNQGYRMKQRCTIMTKLVLRSEPHACAQTAVRKEDDCQMRMTERIHHSQNNADEHRTSTKKVGKTLYSRIATTGLIGLDRARTTHCISSVILSVLRLFHLLMWSQVTFVSTVHFSHRQFLIFIYD